MTVTFKYESRTDHYGTTLWCEEYTDKHSGFKKFWRWGVDNKTCGDLLSSKPNMNRLMKTYLANGEIEVETNTVDSVHKAFNGEGKRKRYTIQNNLSENLNHKPMKKINENRTVPSEMWDENEWDDNFNVTYIFQLSRMAMFEVGYYRIRGNKQPHFATSAQVFCRNKKDISRGGQCQADVLKDFPAAYEFWKKWDKHHLHRFDYKTYQELLEDIEFLKDEYNWDYTKSGDGFPFYREVELSKQKPKRRIVRESAEVDDDYVYGFDRNRKEHIAIRRSTGLVGYGKNKEEALKNIPSKKTYANKVLKDKRGAWIIINSDNESIGTIYKDEKGWWTISWFDTGRKRTYDTFNMARDVARTGGF